MTKKNRSTRKRREAGSGPYLGEISPPGDEGQGGRSGFAPLEQRGPEERPQERQRSSFSGRGGKGYRRTDDRILDLISDRLAGDPNVDARELELDVRDGEVVVRGAAEDSRTRGYLEELISSVPGVTRVQIVHGEGGGEDPGGV